ncbi:MAG: RdgB/HAM1 family non-canonical purine NTP pyrophosphatase [Opitutaceae bacterium]|nr:RdgB/HAM1 family non-canonical purine NTP pyrophosphatase [Opitutaceae bacterium]
MRLYLATGNRHKLGEVTAILAASGITAEVLPPSAVGGMPEVVEDTGTFVGNATKKARALAAKLPAGSWAVADDSGVCVDALDGDPGVESAYYAGHPSNDAANNAKLLAALRGVPEERRGAAFHCCIVAVNTDGSVVSFEGRCPGRVLETPRGTGGFGYDPLFRPDGCSVSYAELDDSVKNTISHRARALAKFVAWLRDGCM